MTDEGLRKAERVWQGQPDDYEAALLYVRFLLRKGDAVAEDLARLLSGRPLDLRHLLMNHHADSYGFWGMVDGEGFKVTVTQWGGEGWAILKHHGDRPVLDDGSMGPNPPHPTQILTEHDRIPTPRRWRPHDAVPDDESEADYEDVYDALRDAINICDGRYVPLDLEETPECSNVIHEWVEEPLSPINSEKTE